MSEPQNVPLVAVIGAGPAGLMAAEVLSNQGVRVEVFDAMPSAGRKFLLAGIGGMNITHSEPLDAFLGRYRPSSIASTPMRCARGFMGWASTRLSAARAACFRPR